MNEIQTWIEWFEDQREKKDSAYNQFLDLGFDSKEALMLTILGRMNNTLDRIEEILEEGR